MTWRGEGREEDRSSDGEGEKEGMKEEGKKKVMETRSTVELERIKKGGG